MYQLFLITMCVSVVSEKHMYVVFDKGVYLLFLIRVCVLVVSDKGVYSVFFTSICKCVCCF